MKWIYGEEHQPNGMKKTYLINPRYIVMIDMNERSMRIKDRMFPLYYNEEDELKIIEMLTE